MRFVDDADFDGKWVCDGRLDHRREQSETCDEKGAKRLPAAGTEESGVSRLNFVLIVNIPRGRSF